MSDPTLLDIQRLDTEADQLRHRHATLPQRTAREEAIAEQARIEEEIETIGAARLEVTLRQKRFEDEAQTFATKADADEKRLYGGDAGMKELQALQDEIAGLRGRQSELEDRVLDAMEEAEVLAERLAEAERQQAGVISRITVLDAELAAAESEIDDQLAVLESERSAAAEVVGGAGLAEYERLRPGLGSATVVRYDGRNCVGCPSTMPAMELDRMKHAEPGSVLNCNECGRIVLT